MVKSTSPLEEPLMATPVASADVATDPLLTTARQRASRAEQDATNLRRAIACGEEVGANYWFCFILAGIVIMVLSLVIHLRN